MAFIMATDDEKECNNCKFEDLKEIEEPCKTCIESEADYDGWELHPKYNIKELSIINEIQEQHAFEIEILKNRIEKIEQLL